MIKSKIIVYYSVFLISVSSTGCVFIGNLLSNPYVQSIIISFGHKLEQAVVIKTVEVIFDKIFGVIEGASEKVTFKDQIQPIDPTGLLGKIPGSDSLHYLINGERNGQQDFTTISIPTSKVMYQRSSIDTNDWELTAESKVLIHNRLEVGAVQISLRNFNYNVEIDGIFGPQTKKAIAQFQQDKGLFKTEILDDATKKTLLIK